jgi:hypothetical protein
LTHRLIFYFLLILFAYPQASRSQPLSRYNTFSYSVNEGLLQSNIIDMQFDSNNFCWLSFANGIQKFDGKKFYEVPLQPGLPDDKWVFFFRTSTGDLLISHSLGISKYNIGSNTFTLVHKNEEASKVYSPVFMGEDEGIIYFITERGLITGISRTDFQVKSKMVCDEFNSLSNTNVGRPTVTGKIINHKLALKTQEQLYLWDFKAPKITGTSKTISNLHGGFITGDTENSCLYCTYQDNTVKIYRYDFLRDTNTLLFEKKYSGPQSFRSHF